MMNMPMATNVARKTLNARVAMTSEWDKVKLISGVDTQNNEHSIRKTTDGVSYQNLPRMTDMEFQSIGAFGELTYDLGNDNQFVTGLRLDQVAGRM